ncbi:MAG: hypothetical protein LBQ48_01600 [Oscillospiraceae bacterium]|jgi:DNA polymerase-3 subunit delta'|nr:hypothetical protein [Oscillospiraceae bacterium]
MSDFSLARKRLDLLISSGRLPNTVIIESAEGAALAARLASAVVCVQPDVQKPCGSCPQCKKAKASTHPDIVEIRGSGTTGSLKVEAARDLRTDAYVQPNDSDRKVYIIHWVQGSTDQAANALLKLLEEPPAYAMFILVCASAAALLPTVRSRGVLISDYAGDTSVQTAKYRKKAVEIASAIAAGDGYACLRMLKTLEKDRSGYKETLSALCGLFSAAFRLWAGIVPSGSNSKAAALGKKSDKEFQEPETANQLKSKYSASRLAGMAAAAQTARDSLDRNASGSLTTLLLAETIFNA